MKKAFVFDLGKKKKKRHEEGVSPKKREWLTSREKGSLYNKKEDLHSGGGGRKSMMGKKWWDKRELGVFLEGEGGGNQRPSTGNMISFPGKGGGGHISE